MRLRNIKFGLQERIEAHRTYPCRKVAESILV
jgi:hypothetical protein